MKERPLESSEYSVGESVCEDILCTNCDRLWEKGPLGSGNQFSVYCPIRKTSFCALKCTLKHKKLIFLTEVIAF